MLLNLKGKDVYRRFFRPAQGSPSAKGELVGGYSSRKIKKLGKDEPHSALYHWVNDFKPYKKSPIKIVNGETLL